MRNWCRSKKPTSDSKFAHNFTFTNPQLLHKTIQSGGQNLAKGMEHLLRDLKARQIKMTDIDAFAPGRNLALTPGQVVFK